MDGRAVGSRQRRYSGGGGPRAGRGDLPALGRTAAAGHGLRAAGDRHCKCWTPPRALRIDDRTTIQLACLQVRVQLRGAQMQDPELTSALALFRRAANILARLEDGIVLDGLLAPGLAPFRPPFPPALFRRAWRRRFRAVWQITSAAPNNGLYRAAAQAGHLVGVNPGPPGGPPPPGAGQRLVSRSVSINPRSRDARPLRPVRPCIGPGPVRNCRDARPKLARAATGPNHSVPGRRIAASILSASAA